MLPVISRQQIKIRRKQDVEAIFKECEQAVNQESFEIGQDFIGNMPPSTIQVILKSSQEGNIKSSFYFPKTKASKDALGQTNLSSISNQQNSTAMTHNSSAMALTDKSNKANVSIGQRKSITYLNPEPINPAAASSTKQQNAKMNVSSLKRKSHAGQFQTFNVDQIEERNGFEDIITKYEREQEEKEKESLKNMTQQQQEEITQKWAEQQISLKRSDRDLSQEVSSTMKLINANLKLIISEQENKRCIRNLTSLETIFQKAREECIDVQFKDPIQEINKKKSAKIQTVSSSVTHLPTLQTPQTKTMASEGYNSSVQSTLQKEDADFVKFTKIEEEKFQLMRQRFSKKLESPNLYPGIIKQSKTITRPGLIIPQKKKEISIEYQPLQTSFSDSIQGSTKKGRQLNSFSDANKNINNTSATNNSTFFHDKTGINVPSANKTMESTTKNNSILGDINDNNLSILNQVMKQYPNSSAVRKIKDKNIQSLSQSTTNQNLTKVKKNALPSFLEQFKQLLLNSWKGKVVPTPEETVLLSNCLGMLSLHTDMTESVHNIKEYNFDMNQRYVAVPSQSSKSLSMADKKFKRAAQNNPDLKQQMINVNIQQLDQLVELEDPEDYLIQDCY